GVACQLMPKLPSVEVELDTMARFRTVDIAEDVDSLEYTPRGGQRFGEPIGGRAAREPFEHHIGRGGPMAQRGGNAHQLAPLLGHQRHIHRGAKDGIEWSVGGHPTDFVELLILQVFDARHELKAQQITEPKELLGIYMDSQDSHAGQGRARPIEPYQPQRDVPPSPWLPVRASHPAAVRGWPPCEHAHRLACFPERHTGPLGIVLGPLKPTSVHRDSHQTHHSWTTTSY